MDWLGIHVPAGLKEEFKSTPNMLERSVQVCLEIASELSALCAGKFIPFGFNIESVAIKNDEIEASIFMVHRIAEILDKHGVRKLAASVPMEK